MYVYADNAAATKISEKAKKAMLPYLDELYANPSAVHPAGQKIKENIHAARNIVARAIGAEQADDIIFTSGGTESNHQAILSAAIFGAGKGKKHIVSTAFEHHSVLHTLNKLKNQGFAITLVAPEKDGIISPEKIASAIREDTALVSVMYANNEIGTIQPIAEIGKICREKEVLFHTDAVQAAGHIPIDVAGDSIDLLSLSGHKFHGAKGAGVLYARKGIPLTRLMEGGGQEKNRRPGTENVPSVISLAAALEESVNNMEKDTAYLTALRNRVIDGLSKIEGSVINGSIRQRLPGNISISFEGVDSESLVLLLYHIGITVSNGSACTSSSTLPSHVLDSIGVPKEYIKGTLRITLSRYNTAEQADYIVKSVNKTVHYLRSLSSEWNEK